MSEDFVLEWYDDDDARIHVHYWISKKGYLYQQYHFDNGTSSKVRRISEAAYLSAFEELINA